MQPLSRRASPEREWRFRERPCSSDRPLQSPSVSLDADETTVGREVSRILLVSGIWPPKWGPFTRARAPDDFLRNAGMTFEPSRRRRGGRVGSAFRSERFDATSRDRRRMVAGTAAIAGATRGVDVVYSIGMYTRSALTSGVTRTPLVIRLVSDPAFERALSLGLFTGSLEQFQEGSTGWRARALKTFRHAALSQATKVVVPSEYLARFVRSWGVSPACVEIVPNSVPTDST